MIETFFFKLSHQQQQEIEELRAKLSDIGRQKEEYDNAMRNGTVPAGGSVATVASGSFSSASSSAITGSSVIAAPQPPPTPATPSNNNSNNSDSDSQTSSPNLTRSAVNSFSDGNSSSNGDTKKAHSSLRGHIRAFLPNNQRTVVRISFFHFFLIFHCNSIRFILSNDI